MSIYEATEVLFASRHVLPSDVIRSLADIYTCASAARYGEPHETGWLDPDRFRDHDTAECEA
jgi:hypothetical protein